MKVLETYFIREVELKRWIDSTFLCRESQEVGKLNPSEWKGLVFSKDNWIGSVFAKEYIYNDKSMRYYLIRAYYASDT